jgi:hypothetical protein
MEAVVTDVAGNDSLPCTNKTDALRLSLARAPGAPGQAGLFQANAYCAVVPNRMFRAQVEDEGRIINVFSAVVSSFADLRAPDAWQRITFEDEELLIDKYSVSMCLPHVITRRWVPAGLDHSHGFAGVELHFITPPEGDGDFVPMDTDRIGELAERQRTHAIAAYEEISRLAANTADGDDE